MPKRKRKIDQHPQKQEIIEALVRGDTYQEITSKYGVSKNQLSDYMRQELGRKVAMVKRDEDILDGTFVLDNAAKAAKSLRKLLESCNTYLQDPDDPDAFAVGPRAEEVDIIVQHYDEEGRPTYTERGTLQDFLTQIEKEKSGDVSEAKYNHADPRKLVIDTANAINRQLGIMAKIQEQAMGMRRDNETRRRVVESEVWEEVSELLIEATNKCPEAREIVARGLERIRSAATGG